MTDWVAGNPYPARPPRRRDPISNGGTPTSDTLGDLSGEESERLRLLALRYHIRRDGTLRPVADVTYDLKSLHGIELSTKEVFELLNRKDFR